MPPAARVQVFCLKGNKLGLRVSNMPVSKAQSYFRRAPLLSFPLHLGSSDLLPSVSQHQGQHVNPSYSVPQADLITGPPIPHDDMIAGPMPHDDMLEHFPPAPGSLPPHPRGYHLPYFT